MSNEEAIAPAFEYMPTLDTGITILMGDADQLAGPANIARLQDVAERNSDLKLHLFAGSNHGFFTDIDGNDDLLRNNAMNGIGIVNDIVYPVR